VFNEEESSDAARACVAVLLAIALDARPVEILLSQSSAFGKRSQSGRVVEEIDELAGPWSGECKSICEITVVKLLQVAMGNVLVAADQPNDVPSPQKAVAGNRRDDFKASICYSLALDGIWNANRFGEATLHSIYSRPKRSSHCFDR
jgi:hypothetical protein